MRSEHTAHQTMLSAAECRENERKAWAKALGTPSLRREHHRPAKGLPKAAILVPLALLCLPFLAEMAKVVY